MMNHTIIMQKMTRVKRVYAAKDVSDMTLDEINAFIENEGITYSGDYGFRVTDSVQLIHSLN